MTAVLDPVTWARRGYAQELASAIRLATQCRLAARISRTHRPALRALAQAQAAAVVAIAGALYQLPQTEVPYV